MFDMKYNVLAGALVVAMCAACSGDTTVGFFGSDGDGHGGGGNGHASALAASVGVGGGGSEDPTGWRLLRVGDGECDARLQLYAALPPVACTACSCTVTPPSCELGDLHCSNGAQPCEFTSWTWGAGADCAETPQAPSGTPQVLQCRHDVAKVTAPGECLANEPTPVQADALSACEVNEGANCIAHDGRVACPDGLPNERVVWADLDDQRQCMGCQCAVTSSECSGGGWEYFAPSNITCDGDAAAVASTDGSDCAEVTLLTPGSRVHPAAEPEGSATCSATGSEATGSVSGRPITLCCLD